MSKKMIAATSVMIAVFATAMPVYAQSTTPTGSPGFFGEIEGFFGNLFHRQKGVSSLNHDEDFQNQNVTPGQNAMQQNPSGMPDYFSMQESRVSSLVQQGKITQAKGDAIIAELQKVHTELISWAAAEGINESYVIGGPGAGMGERQGGFQNDSNPSVSTQQFQGHGMMSPGGHGGGFQQGGEGGQSGSNRIGE